MQYSSYLFASRYFHSEKTKIVRLRLMPSALTHEKDMMTTQQRLHNTYSV